MKSKITKAIDPIILGIDTSCDETSVAILHGRKVLTSVVSSQVELHKKWGGVVPDIARRAHSENIEKVYKEALKRSRKTIEEIDYIAVTYGPGLAIALEIGLDFAKKLALENSKPLIPVNHMEGHMIASFCLNSRDKGKILDENIFPFLSLLVSGNHTELIYSSQFGKYRVLGQTLDDAAGEAFDKVARMLNLGYPGGPIMTYLADRGNLSKAEEFELPVPMERSGDYNFSYSGLKTSCMYKIKKIREAEKKDSKWSADFALAFINSVSKSLECKLQKAIDEFPEVKSVLIGGGVTNNKYIVRGLLYKSMQNNKAFYVPEQKYRSDNAAMIAIAAYYGEKYRYLSILSGKDIEDIDREPMLSL